MKLNINFPKSMVADDLLKQKRIPCFCKVSKEFEISFSDTAAFLKVVVASTV